MHVILYKTTDGDLTLESVGALPVSTEDFIKLALKSSIYPYLLLRNHDYIWQLSDNAVSIDGDDPNGFWVHGDDGEVIQFEQHDED